MLLRITQITGGTKLHPPLHVCLTTTPSDSTNTPPESQHTNVVSLSSYSQDSGEVLTIGRKDCDLIIDDRCISRNHASLRLLSDRHGTPTASQTMTMGRMEFGTPSDPDQIAACASSIDGVICCLGDLGSKSGTFVSVDSNLTTEVLGGIGGGRRNGEDDSGDETDEDGGPTRGGVVHVELTEIQARAVRLLNNETDTRAKPPKFQKIEPNSSLVLLPLSHSKRNPHVTILFGQQGSGIRIALVPLQFTFSLIPSAVQNRLVSRFHYIGARHSPSWDVHHSTHLVTSAKKATAKHIAAWACRKPMVTEGYLHSLLARSKPTDTMPKEEDFLPSGDSILDDLKLDGPCAALEGYRMAVFDDDTASLVQSAGADVLHLLRDAPNTEPEFRSWWKDRVQRAVVDNKALVVMEATSKKATCSKWLNGNDVELRCTNQRNLAKAITGKSVLLDAKNDAIEKPSGWDQGDSVVERKDKVDETMDDDATDAEFDDVPATEERKNGDDAPMVVNTLGKRAQEVVHEESSDDPKTYDHDVLQPNPKRRKESEATSTSIPEMQSQDNDDAVNNEPENAIPTPSHANNNERITRDEDSCDGSVPEDRIPLPMGDNGWYLAAPASRKNYRRKIDDTPGTNDDERPRSAAKTQRVTGLIVPLSLPPPSGGARLGTKPDYKRFRKNNVIRGVSSFHNNENRAPPVRLVSVLPKETERQRQLEMQRQELEREQEFADSLFNDGGKGGGGRRSGGAGMLSQSSTRRGRVRG